MARIGRGIAASAAVVGTLIAAPAASAAVASLPPVERTLVTQTAAKRTCSDAVRSRSRSRGVATTTYRAPLAGFVTVRLAASERSDWDLALFDGGRAVASSQSFGSHEVAQRWVAAGDVLTIQGCLRTGSAKRARVAIRFFDVAPKRLEGSASLVRVQVSDGAQVQALEEMGFDVTHNIRRGFVDVIVTGTKQADALKASGLKYETRIANLSEQWREARAADARFAATRDASPLPSGRTGYRDLEDYQTELKQIAEQHSSIAKPVTIGKTYQGRSIDGVELSSNVNAADDGKPTYVVVGMHHAREWPSAESAMEFAWMLAKGYGSDARITSLLERERVVVIPIDNVDGFVSTRSMTQFSPTDQAAEGDGHEMEEVYTVEVVAPGGPPGAYRRKNCVGQVPSPSFPCELQHGVDPNRNYGQGWGGFGASTDPFSQTYRGKGPWSEPETKAFWEFSQKRNITAVISIHNVAALVLRPPGRRSDGFAPDEPLLKEIGDKMADATGYTSQFGWQLYDTSGTTEDWNYAAQGALGYTIEIGPEDGYFHMPYETGVVKEWVGDPAKGRTGMAGALLIGAESAANPAYHSTLAGRAPAGRVLRLRKDFKTSTSPICTFSNPSVSSNICPHQGPAQQVDDFIDYTTVVPASGRFQWMVGPSTRPFVRESWLPGNETAIGGESKTGSMPPGADFVEVPFTLPGGLWRANFELTWQPANASDLDLELYWKDTTTGEFRKVGSSGNPPGAKESTSLIQPREGEYKAKIINYAGGDGQPYELKITYLDGNIEVKPGSTEAYRLTCETPDGKVVEERAVTIGRGEQQDLGSFCGAGAVAGARQRSGRVTISRKPARLTRSGRAGILLSCSKAGPCAGELRLYRGGRRVVGRRAYSLAAGSRKRVSVKVSRAVRRRARVLAVAGPAKRAITLRRTGRR